MVLMGPLPEKLKNFSACLNLTFDLYEGHMIKNNFFKYTPPRHHSSGKTTCYTALCFDTPVHTIENAS